MITNRRALPGVVGAGLGDHTRAPAHTIRVFRHRPLAGRACYWDPHSRNLPRFPYWNLIVTLGYTHIPKSVHLYSLLHCFIASLIKGLQSSVFRSVGIQSSFLVASRSQEIERKGGGCWKEGQRRFRSYSARTSQELRGLRDKLRTRARESGG